MGRGGNRGIYINAIEKLFEVTCVLTLSFHDDPKNDLDERYIWSDVTLSMSRFPFLCYSLSLSLSLSLCLYVSLFLFVRACACVCVFAREGGQDCYNLRFLAIGHRPW